MIDKLKCRENNYGLMMKIGCTNCSVEETTTAYVVYHEYSGFSHGRISYSITTPKGWILYYGRNKKFENFNKYFFCPECRKCDCGNLFESYICDSDNLSDDYLSDNYCTNCGNNIYGEARLCRCGRRPHKNDKFCKGCGNRANV